jgi:hypothetical protein
LGEAKPRSLDAILLADIRGALSDQIRLNCAGCTLSASRTFD